jgi:hypothetical protein
MDIGPIFRLISNPAASMPFDAKIVHACSISAIAGENFFADEDVNK